MSDRPFIRLPRRRGPKHPNLSNSACYHDQAADKTTMMYNCHAIALDQNMMLATVLATSFHVLTDLAFILQQARQLRDRGIAI